MSTRGDLRYGVARACLWLGAWASIACNQARETPINPVVGNEKSSVGLFTPGSTLGAVTEAAPAAGSGGAGGEMMMVAAPTGDRCVGSSGDPGTPCMMTVTFTTTLIGEHWQPENVGAVWIENASGTYIKTLERWAAIRSRSLYQWADHACATSWPEMDALSRATLPDHSSQHSVTWDGRDFMGKVVPDGAYKLFIEVTETETNYGPLGVIDFQKNATASMVQPPDTPPFAGLTLMYMPSAGGEDEPSDAGEPHADAGGGMNMNVDAGSGTIEGAGSSGATSGGEPGLDAGPTLTP
jgi:hypothetical protein